jgi:hypothetical protein
MLVTLAIVGMQAVMLSRSHPRNQRARAQN